jgi:hypothetical protein
VLSSFRLDSPRRSFTVFALSAARDARWWIACAGRRARGSHALLDVARAFRRRAPHPKPPRPANDAPLAATSFAASMVALTVNRPRLLLVIDLPSQVRYA